MTKKTIVLCQLQLAKTHVHPCLDFSLSILEVVDETLSVAEVLDVEVTVTVAAEVATFGATLELALEALLEVFLEENKKIIMTLRMIVSIVKFLPLTRWKK